MDNYRSKVNFSPAKMDRTALKTKLLTDTKFVYRGEFGGRRRRQRRSRHSDGQLHDLQGHPERRISRHGHSHRSQQETDRVHTPVRGYDCHWGNRYGGISGGGGD